MQHKKLIKVSCEEEVLKESVCNWKEGVLQAVRTAVAWSKTLIYLCQLQCTIYFKGTAEDVRLCLLECCIYMNVNRPCVIFDS